MRAPRRCSAANTTPKLPGLRVLLTGTQGESSDVARLLEEHGAQVSFAPLIRIGPPPSERELRHAIDRSPEFDWLVFTSSAGVEAFAARDGSPTAHQRIAVVGPATAQTLLQELGRAADLMPERYSGEALADALAQRVGKYERLLYFAAQDARPALETRLRAAGLDVHKVEAYSTVEQPPLDLEAQIASHDVVTLASPSAVRALVHGLGEHGAEKLRGKLLACIGPVTLLEARQSGLHVEITPESATLVALVDALCAYYSSPRS
jgi:uroporphyrinogen-III synthase